MNTKQVAERLGIEPKEIHKAKEAIGKEKCIEGFHYQREPGKNSLVWTVDGLQLLAEHLDIDIRSDLEQLRDELAEDYVTSYLEREVPKRANEICRKWRQERNAQSWRAALPTLFPQTVTVEVLPQGGSEDDACSPIS